MHKHKIVREKADAKSKSPSKDFFDKIIIIETVWYGAIIFSENCPNWAKNIRVILRWRKKKTDEYKLFFGIFIWPLIDDD